MKNKGFTLIELLGVIVILSLLALLVFPSIINSIKSSSEKTDELTRELIFSAADLYVSNHSNIYPKIEGNKYTILLQDLIDEGYLTKSLKVSTSEDITYEQCIQVTYKKDFEFNLADSSTCSPKCYLYNDQENLGVIDTGDKVKCDYENEKFYVISNEDGKVEMITEYNIGCGSNSIRAEQTKNANFCAFYKTTSFPDFNTLEDVYTKNKGDKNLYIYEVFEKYKKNLINKGVNIFDIKPISYNELLELGCTEEGMDNCKDALRWVTYVDGEYVKYWTRTGDNTTRKPNVFIVDDMGIYSEEAYFENSSSLYDSEEGAGYRPVISIQEKDINIS